MNSYLVGNILRVSMTFRDVNGNLIDPQNVYAQTRVGMRGTEKLYTYGSDTDLVKESTGVYHVDINLNEVGDWACRVYSTGDVQASNSLRFKVREF